MATATSSMQPTPIDHLATLKLVRVEMSQLLLLRGIIKIEGFPDSDGVDCGFV